MQVTETYHLPAVIAFFGFTENIQAGLRVPEKKGGKVGESAVNRNSRQHRPNRGYSNRRSPQLQKEVFATTVIGLMILV